MRGMIVDLLARRGLAAGTGGLWIDRRWLSTGTGRCGRCWAVPRSARSRPGMARRGSHCTAGGAGSSWGACRD